jgi:hypothetical protein
VDRRIFSAGFTSIFSASSLARKGRAAASSIRRVPWCNCWSKCWSPIGDACTIHAAARAACSCRARSSSLPALQLARPAISHAASADCIRLYDGRCLPLFPDGNWVSIDPVAGITNLQVTRSHIQFTKNGPSTIRLTMTAYHGTVEVGAGVTTLTPFDPEPITVRLEKPCSTAPACLDLHTDLSLTENAGQLILGVQMHSPTGDTSFRETMQRT